MSDGTDAIELKPMLHRDALATLVHLVSGFVVSAAHRGEPKEVEAMMKALLWKVEHCNTLTECPKIRKNFRPLSLGGFWWVDESGQVSQ